MSFVTIDAAAAAECIVVAATAVTAVRSECPFPRDVLASEDGPLLSPDPLVACARVPHLGKRHMLHIRHPPAALDSGRDRYVQSGVQEAL